MAIYEQLSLLNPVMKTRPQTGHMADNEETVEP